MDNQGTTGYTRENKRGAGMSKIFTETIDKFNITSLDKLPEKEREKAFGKYIDGLNMKASKLFDRLLKYMDDNNQTIDALLFYLAECPPAFAYGFYEQNRDFFKWAIQQNTDRNNKLIEMITAVEKEYELPKHPSEAEK